MRLATLSENLSMGQRQMMSQRMDRVGAWFHLLFALSVATIAAITMFGGRW
jgi:hypothetical protein